MNQKNCIAALLALVLLSISSASVFAAGTKKADPYTDGGLAGRTSPHCDPAKTAPADKFTDGA